MISIHALREEGDDNGFVSAAELNKFLSTPSARRATQGGQGSAGVLHISIHALREEGDSPGAYSPGRVTIFLSTPSARRATGLHPQGAAAA